MTAVMKKLRALPVLWKPHKYQLKSEEFLLKRKAAALFLDPGLGKTSVTLSALLKLRNRAAKAGKGWRALVVAPLRVCYNVWPDEALKWKNFETLKVEVFHGRPAAEIPKSAADVIVVNFDYIPKLLAGLGGPMQLTPEKFKRIYGFDVLVIDELSAFKHTTSKRFKLFRKVTDSFDVRWGLTGSPVANRVIDIFGQALILDGGKTFGRYITHFRNEYFVPTGYGGYDWKPKDKDAERRIFDKLKPMALRLAAEDYLDMPLLILDDRTVTMPPKLQKSYLELQNDLITAIKDKTVAAVSKAAALNKCRQFASGALYRTPSLEELAQDAYGPVDAKQVLSVHSEKYDALKELVEELQGEPLLVGIGFRFEADIIKKRFSGAEVIYGGTAAGESMRIIDAWNRGEVPLLAAHPGSLAHGVNLQAGGHHICWLTLPWDNEQYDQFNRRLYRQGAKSKKVFIHRLCAKDTVDGYIRGVLGRKRMTQGEFFEYLRASF